MSIGLLHWGPSVKAHSGPPLPYPGTPPPPREAGEISELLASACNPQEITPVMPLVY